MDENKVPVPTDEDIKAGYARQVETNVENSMKQINEKDRLNWLEKIAVKRLLKSIKKQLKKDVGRLKKQSEINESVAKAIMKLNEVIEVTNEDGSDVTIDDLMKLTGEELMQTFEDCIKEAERTL